MPVQKILHLGRLYEAIHNLNLKSSIPAKMNFWAGGTSPSGLTTLLDQTAPINNYFNSMRLPATFLATQALNSLFRLRKTRENLDDEIEKLLTSVTQFLVLIAFMTAITSVVSGTAAGVKVLHGSFNPLASTPYQVLISEFEFEFLSCRLNFIISIFAFLVGTGTHSIVQFDLLEPGRKKLLILFVSSIVSITSYLISYFNSHVYDYGSLVGMSCDFIRLIFVRIPKAEPLIVLFVASTLVTAVLLLELVLTPLFRLLLPPAHSDRGKRFPVSF